VVSTQSTTRSRKGVFFFFFFFVEKEKGNLFGEFEYSTEGRLFTRAAKKRGDPQQEKPGKVNYNHSPIA
jgi:hypothetical protein